MSKDTFTLQLFGEVENLLRARPELFRYNENRSALNLELHEDQIYIIIHLITDPTVLAKGLPYKVQFFIKGKEYHEDLHGVPQGFSDAVLGCLGFLDTQAQNEGIIESIKTLQESFGELIGVEPTKPEPLTVVIPGVDEEDATLNLSWILRGFVAEVKNHLLPGRARREEAGRIVRGIVASIQDADIREQISAELEGHHLRHL